MYEATSTNEMIIIEYVESPSYLKGFFTESSIYRIERFDYPFPQDDTDYIKMFYDNTESTYINLTNFSFINAVNLKNMFCNCEKLETIIFPSEEKAEKIEVLSNMFENSKSLQSVDLSFFSYK
jgi:hypothetical protein